MRGVEIQLESELAGVPGAADEHVEAEEFELAPVIVFRQGGDVQSERGQHRRRIRTLQVEFRHGVGEVFEFDGRGKAFAEFGEIDRDPCGVHHDEELLRAHPVHDQVVDHAARFVQQEIVAADAVLLVRHGTRQRGVERFGRAGSGGGELAHVADVEQRDVFPCVLVFGEDAFLVLDRHVPAGEWDHARAERDVFVGQRGFEESFVHGKRLSAREPGNEKGHRIPLLVVEKKRIRII